MCGCGAGLSLTAWSTPAREHFAGPSSPVACGQSALLAGSRSFTKLYGIVLSSELKKPKVICETFCEFEFMIGGCKPVILTVQDNNAI